MATPAGQWKIRNLTATVCALAVGACVAEARQEADGRAIEDLTGSHTRLAWIRGTALVRLDTRDGKGEVTIPSDKAAARPIITPTGRQIVFICFPEWTSHIVDWNGENLRYLVTGRVTHVRMDEKGTEWAYWQTPANEMMTARLDSMGNATSVWKFPYPAREGKTDNFQTSADGRRAAASIPWPQVGSAALPQTTDRDFVNYGVGCWPQIARDNSYRVFHLFTGKHNRLALYDPSGTEARFISCMPNPKRAGCENPRWSNDPRILIGTDQSWHDLPPDIYLGKFNDAFTEIGKWLRVTRQGNNSEPDCWVAAAARYPGPATASAEIRQPSGDGDERAWPGSHASLSFLWSSLGAKNLVNRHPGKLHRRCVMTLKGMARPRHFGSVDLSNGYAVSEGLDATFPAELRSAAAISVEFVITPQGEPSGTILSFGSPLSPASIAIEQADNALVLAIPDASNGVARMRVATLQGRTRNGVWSASPLQHVVVALTSERATAYINGETTVDSLPVQVDFSKWKPGQIYLGSDPAGETPWGGLIEGVAVFASCLSREDAARHCGMYTMKYAARGVDVTVRKVRGLLMEKTQTPALEQIQPYPRALVAYRYKVESVKNGKPVVEEMEVDHWAWLDSKKVIAEKEVGQVYDLRIEPAAWYTTLKYERLVSTLSDPAGQVWIEVLQ